jgi:hypothetical protein
MISKTFIVDDYAMVGNKKFALNLNVYRNAHYQTLNKAKTIFKNQLFADYPELYRIKAQRVEIEYYIERCDKRVFDTMNIISIVDKFFCDALVLSGCIHDDNYNYVTYKAPRVSDYVTKSPNKKIHIFCTFY